MHQVYIFDFDGTLVDSMPHFGETMISVLDRRGISYPENIVEIITPLGYQKTAEYYIDELGVKATTEELIEEMTKLLLVKYRDVIPLKDGVEECLRALKEKGKRLYVLTASPHSMLDPCLKHTGVFDLFEEVWSCEDFSASKSNPDIYRKAAEKIGVSVEEIAFFDDNINAVAAAKSAGVYAVGVYDLSGDAFKPELKEISDVYIESFCAATEV